MSEQVNISTLIRRVEGLSDAAADMAQAVRDSGSLDAASKAVDEHENKTAVHLAAFNQHDADLDAHPGIFGVKIRRRVSNPKLYVRLDGKDGNDGYSADKAFRTIARAMDEFSRIDCQQSDAAIYLGSGTFYEPLNFIFLHSGGARTFQVFGDAAGTVLDGSDDAENVSGVVYNQTSARAYISDIHLDNWRDAIICAAGGYLQCNNISVGKSRYSHFRSTVGGRVLITGKTSIQGAAPSAFFADSSGYMQIGETVTVENNPSFNTFARVHTMGVLALNSSCTITGAATGSRYNSDASLISVGGRGPNAFPGTTAGTVANGGIYR